ncbi:hypothetical protein OPT61_g4798 [Boeremia exigua]|uniref:Uncharacterized protein n=1 Tax=Boeremia exigua TaxID=749465 RepID=A0ACC2ICP5_9PLEO|nr:hypothetical protein OPT61_g4798 [Boeremia exigua]
MPDSNVVNLALFGPNQEIPGLGKRRMEEDDMDGTTSNEDETPKEPLPKRKTKRPKTTPHRRRSPFAMSLLTPDIEVEDEQDDDVREAFTKSTYSEYRLLSVDRLKNLQLWFAFRDLRVRGNDWINLRVIVPQAPDDEMNEIPIVSDQEDLDDSDEDVAG